MIDDSEPFVAWARRRNKKRVDERVRDCDTIGLEVVCTVYRVVGV